MDLTLLWADFFLPEEGFLPISSAYAGDHACVQKCQGTSACRHGLGRGGMRSSKCRLSDVSLPCFGGFRWRADDPTKP